MPKLTYLHFFWFSLADRILKKIQSQKDKNILFPEGNNFTLPRPSYFMGKCLKVC